MVSPRKAFATIAGAKYRTSMILSRKNAALLQDMRDTMAHLNGAGLAAIKEIAPIASVSSYENLFGRIDYRQTQGALSTDFS